jgi:hypothetical protein
MEKKPINRKELLEEFSKKLSKKVDILKQNPDKSYKPIHTLIIKTLVNYEWEPEYNEKAIMINFFMKRAWHLWYTEKMGHKEYRFREVPNDFPIIFNFYSQDNIRPPSKKIYDLILPLAIFKEIRKIIKFKVWRDKHKELKDSPLIRTWGKKF